MTSEEAWPPQGEDTWPPQIGDIWAIFGGPTKVKLLRKHRTLTKSDGEEFADAWICQNLETGNEQTWNFAREPEGFYKANMGAGFWHLIDRENYWRTT